MSDKKRTLPTWFISNGTLSKKSKDATLKSESMHSTDSIRTERVVNRTDAHLENMGIEINSSNATDVDDALVVSNSVSGSASSLLPANSANNNNCPYKPISNERSFQVNDSAISDDTRDSASDATDSLLPASSADNNCADAQIAHERSCQVRNSAASVVAYDSTSGATDSLTPANIGNISCSSKQIAHGGSCLIGNMNASSSVVVSVDEISSTTCDTNQRKKNRPLCAYEPHCYRRNEEHRLQFAHHDDDNGQPTCLYGTSCYRKSEAHKQAFSHNKPSTIRSRHVTTLPVHRRPRRQENDTNRDSDDDDDDIDSFLNDSSTDFEPTSDEDDDDVSDEGEPESIKRLLRESKKFAKGK